MGSPSPQGHGDSGSEPPMPTAARAWAEYEALRAEAEAARAISNDVGTEAGQRAWELSHAADWAYDDFRIARVYENHTLAEIDEWEARDRAEGAELDYFTTRLYASMPRALRTRNRTGDLEARAAAARARKEAEEDQLARINAELSREETADPGSLRAAELRRASRWARSARNHADVSLYLLGLGQEIEAEQFLAAAREESEYAKLGMPEDAQAEPDDPEIG